MWYNVSNDFFLFIVHTQIVSIKHLVNHNGIRIGFQQENKICKIQKKCWKYKLQETTSLRMSKIHESGFVPLMCNILP